MNEFSLTRKQVLQLAKIATKFPEAPWFTLDEDTSTGIGPVVRVKLCAFDSAQDYDTVINITDVDSW